ncbi:MAG: hypothetical protein WCR97_04145 [Bacilli bacterium]
MAKSKKNLVGLLIGLGVVVFAVAAFFMQFAVGVTFTASSGSVSATGAISGVTCVYGGAYNGTLTAVIGGISSVTDISDPDANVAFNWGSFIGYYLFLVAAILLAVSFLMKNKKNKIILGSITIVCFLTGTILTFCEAPLFTSANAYNSSEGYGLGIGAILGGIFGLIATFGGVAALVKSAVSK